MNKKALAVIAGPFRLYQAIYFTYLFGNYDWDIVIMDYGKDKEIKRRMYDISVKCGRFNDIYMSDTLTQFDGIGSLLYECCKMALYFISGRRKVHSKKLILKTIGEFNHSLVCIACSYSLLEGALLNFTREKEIILMEEGLDDYVEHSTNLNFIKYIGAKLLYRMQYINLLCNNDYAPLKNCVKYVRYPNLIKKNQYKCVKEVLNYSIINNRQFEETIRECFNIQEENFDMIIYTSELSCYQLEKEYDKFIKYFEHTYNNKNILLKRHPQDRYNYKFKKNRIEEKYIDIPGEIIMRTWNNAEHIFLFPSTILIGLKEMNINFKVIRFKSSKNKYYNEAFWANISFLGISKEEILDI